MKEIAFNLKKYLEIQRKEILKRVSSFDDKLYLEFGGKLCDDFHAYRVLPGFKPDTKLQVLVGMKERVEIVIVINTEDIILNKVRADLGISYELEVERLIDAYTEAGLYVSSVVFSFYEPNAEILGYERKLQEAGLSVYHHYKINGYPQNIPLIVSEDGLGKNEYIKTTKPVVVVTAPGPGSGKMAVCLSQLYHDSKNKVKAGYAKYETFPIWNLAVKHPLNLAYEAATVDLNDVNMIDPYHLAAYKKTATNYNRDIEVFPLLNAIFQEIYGKSPYKSPTDMGVNMAGFAICNEDVACRASEQEIIRRYYQARKYRFLGKFDDTAVSKAELLMNQANVSVSDRECVAVALQKEKDCGQACIALQIGKKKFVTGKRTTLFNSSAALLLNALKTFAKIDDSIPLLSKGVIQPMVDMKVGFLKNHNPRLHAEEILLALSLQATTNPLAELALKQIPKLKGLEAHSTCIVSDADLNTFAKLGIRLTEEPISISKNLYYR